MITQEDFEKKINEQKSLYPNDRSATMPMLHYIQDKCGYIPEKYIQQLSKFLNIPEIEIRELISFYTFFKLKPLGKYHIKLCNSLMCGLTNNEALIDFIRQRLGKEQNSTSEDGVWSYEIVECLGACDMSPAVMINETLFGKLTPEKLAELMRKIESEAPDLKLIEE